MIRYCLLFILITNQRSVTVRCCRFAAEALWWRYIRSYRVQVWSGNGKKEWNMQWVFHYWFWLKNWLKNLRRVYFEEFLVNYVLSTSIDIPYFGSFFYWCWLATFSISVPCSPGSYLSSSQSRCVLCPNHQYTNLSRLTRCIRCEDGFHSPRGATSCTQSPTEEPIDFFVVIKPRDEWNNQLINWTMVLSWVCKCIKTNGTNMFTFYWFFVFHVLPEQVRGFIMIFV